MGTMKINFEFRKEFILGASSVEDAEAQIIQLIQNHLDVWRDEDDCCSFEILTPNPEPCNMDEDGVGCRNDRDR